jgi:deazaflavin-dependent oxidoreductase (nitroreductase family)
MSGAQREYVVGRGRRAINRVYTVLTRFGLGASYRQLLTVTGRRTGLTRTTPVDVMSVGGRSYLVAPYGEVAWVHNVRAAGLVTLSRSGRSHRYLSTELSEVAAAPVIRSYIARVPVTRAWWSVGADASEEELQGEASRHPVFELEPVRDLTGLESDHAVQHRDGASWRGSSVAGGGGAGASPDAGCSCAPSGPALGHAMLAQVRAELRSFEPGTESDADDADS